MVARAPKAPWGWSSLELLVLIAVLLALIPAVAVLYPFLRRPDQPLVEDESFAYLDLTRRWDAAVAGLKNAELDHAIGNLTDDDYAWLRAQYIADATHVMKALDLEEQQESEFLSGLEAEVLKAREAVDGPPPRDPAPEADRE